VLEYLPHIIEVTILVAMWAVAAGLTLGIRKRIGRERVATTTPLGFLKDLVAFVARPVMVLVVTHVVLFAAVAVPTWSEWFGAHTAHLDAWQMFWIGVTGIEFVHGLIDVFFRWRGRSFPLPDLLLQIIRAVLVLAVAFIVIKVELGYDIGPLLASTALITAVVGFALQGVLGNLLAGISMHVVRSLEPGVWVSIDGLEGKVIKTNWRETRIRTRGGHLYILPNAKVADANIHHMQEPTPLRRHIVEVGASYSDAPDEVIAALISAAREVEEVRTAPAPQVHITAYLDFGINYELEYWTMQYHRHRPIDGKVNRMIWYKFKRAGIEIPFPMSDKLLNDFMAVVYNQRRLPPSDVALDSIVDDLRTSDLCTKLAVDEQGEPLLDRADLEKIAPRVRRLPFTHGETLCVQGEEGETFWIVASGKLAGTVDTGGEAAVTFELLPGTVVGEMSALTGVPRSATLTVAESAELLEFPPAAFRALLALHDQLPERLSALAAERIEQNRHAMEELARARSDQEDVTLEKAGILRRLLRMIGR
jgi:small-conductance mechanosensitive channel/CRP-like cAMP-binding protein